MKNILIIIYLLFSFACSHVAVKEDQSLNPKYLTLEKRISVLLELKDKLKEEYAFFTYKVNIFDINFKKVIDEQIKIEKNILPPASSAEAAEQNLLFNDRLRKLLSLFNDTHLEAAPVEKLPYLSLGFTLTESRGRFLVTELSRQSPLQLRDEIIYLDDKPPSFYLETLKNFKSCSSEKYCSLSAASEITERDYFYPKKALVKAMIKRNGKLMSAKLYWSRNKNEKSFYDEYFDSIGIKIKEIKFSAIPFYIKSLPLNQLKTYYSDKGEVVLRVGELPKNGNTFVIQLFSFPETFYLDGKKLNFEDEITSMITKIKDDNNSLVLDLRYNRGGLTDHAPMIYALLAKKKISEGFSSYYAVSPRLMKNFDNKKGYKKEKLYLAKAKIRKEPLSEAVNIDSEILAEGKTFLAPVITLISPNCISSCDLLAYLLKINKASVLIGDDTNGTGAGVVFFTKKPYLNDYLDLYQFIIPNFAVGKSFNHDNIKGLDRSPLTIENIPTKPDIYLQEEENDLFSSSNDFYQKIYQHLNDKTNN